ncbi:MAG: DegT/DnrJ/EryC1/StrS family aminotransferase, partial [Planctomycetota bacterium]|nr:DegT/DnrJ/EryC1/StrS family aminotransferase [Planctomycetota bacterium]
MRVPMSSPDLGAAEVEAVSRVLQTSHLSLGPQLAEFEQRFAIFAGARQAVAVSSGTAGLHLCVIAAGVGEGDLVITTPFSFIASANVILYERAIPIFVDVDPATGNISPTLAAECAHALRQGGAAAQRWLPPALRHRGGKNRQAKALLPVHAFGLPADLDPLLAVARQCELMVIEDACEAIGAEYKGRKVGTFGDAAVFAFYPNKQMTTGEGGMIVSDREDWAALFRSLRNQGRDVFDAWLNHTRLGYNYRLDEMSAALGIVQLQRLPELLAKRERVARWYDERLADIEMLERPSLMPAAGRRSWFVYVVRIKPPAQRDEVMRLLEDEGIPSRPYFTAIHLQRFYREQFGYRPGDFPVACLLY